MYTEHMIHNLKKIYIFKKRYKIIKIKNTQIHNKTGENLFDSFFRQAGASNKTDYKYKTKPKKTYREESNAEYVLT